MTSIPLSAEAQADVQANAQAIVSAHQARLALPIAQDSASTATPIAAQAIKPTDSEGGAVYQSAKQACLAMGFIEQDAQCVAMAWQAQVRRTGHFDPADWPTTAHDFGMQAWPRRNAFAPCPKKLGLYAVLPDAAWVSQMAQAGVPILQLRFKSEDTAAIEREVHAAVAAVQGTQALLFINDHWQAAIKAGAYGVHLGQEDMETADLNAIRQAGLRLGLSSHGYAEMMRADALSPSYIAMGAVFPTTLKRMATAPQGLGRLYAYAQLMQDYPLVAIGGIDAEKFSAVLGSGVGSIAVVRAITAAIDPQAVAKALLAQII